MAAAHVRLMHNPLMARLFPSDIDAIGSSAPLEAATALRLRDELPGDWWVIHACHWTLPAGRKIGQVRARSIASNCARMMWRASTR